ncbi:MAG: NnrS family protein [Actinomycetota bacterium]
MAPGAGTPVARSGRYARAHRLFFPLAAAYSAAAVPLWWAEWAGWLPAGSSARHGHEMLLGFAGAVLAGYLFTKVTRAALLLAALCWATARLAAWTEPGGWVETAATLAFPLILFALGGWPFLKAARAGRNLVFGPAIAAFAVAEAVYQLGRAGLVAGGERQGALMAFDLVALMILVMGGRVIPAAMAGLVRREESRELFHRNGPRLELASVAGMASAFLCHALAKPDGIAAAGMALAGGAAMVRHARWRPELALRDPSMGPIQAGYVLLCVGLVLSPLLPGPDILHLATVGGIGIVTSAMMLRITHIRERAPAPMPAAAVPIAAVLAVAAVVRAGASLAPAILIPASAALWSAAFLGLAAALVRVWR